MARKDKLKVPKRILGFKLSKGTRKDLKTLRKMFADQETSALAISIAGGLSAVLAELFAHYEIEKHAQARSTLAH
jgi:hypothetical protein